MGQPQVIFLDAVGTLFGVRGSVGEVYHAIALSFGVDVPSELLQDTFMASFKSASPMEFPGVPSEALVQKEYHWWEEVARSTFQQAGYYDNFTDFPGFFEELYTHFATAEPWYVYPDILPALAGWRSKGIKLGIISNFDSRLFSVLEALELQDFFTSVTISSEVGAAKPNPKIFQTALAKHGYEPEQAWHIGDSLKEDYQGAKAVGIEAYLIER